MPATHPNLAKENTHSIHPSLFHLSQVPGSPNDSMTSNTALGRAIGSACEELADLAALEAEAADAAAALLLKLGYKVGKGAGGKEGDGAGEGKAVDETTG